MPWNLEDPADRAEALKHEMNVRRIRRDAERAIRMEERGAIEPPETLTLRERLAKPPSPEEWRITGVHGIGHRGLMAAQHKAGKSTLVGNVARSLLDDTPFLDKFDVSPIQGTVAQLDFEMAERQLDDWYRAQGIKADDRLLLLPMRGRAASFDITDADVRSRWASLLRTRGVKYLILDCLRPVLDAIGLNEHTDAGLFLVAFDALLAEANIAEALVVHHMGHANERARGDSRLLDWPDVLWTLLRGSEDPASARFFKAYGRGVDVPETQLTFNPLTRRLSVVGGSRKEAKGRSALRAVVQHVADSSEAPSGRAIEDALAGEHAQGVVRRAVKDAVRLGHLAKRPGRNGGFTYQATQDAKTRAPEEF